MKIARGITELIGHTPLVRLTRLVSAYGVNAEILAKLEMVEPTGSVKDRAALQMILTAELEGKLTEDSTIVEPTSGNTGIGLVAVACAKGYRVILTMPESMSVERRQLLAAYGAELVLTPAKEGMNGAVKRAAEIAAVTPKSWIAGQFENPANPMAHYLTTGVEILDQTDGKLDAFVAGIGTGGTLSGTAKRLREANAKVYIVGVEPASSPLISQGYTGSHGLQGIGANFVPANFDASLTDEIITIENEEAFEMCRKLVKMEGLLVGITSGAALTAAIKLASRAEFAGKRIVVLLPDGGTKYLSTGIFDAR